jgi:UDP-N-acetylglucosamine--N-acetylmuramyl-(pentapeptide) pyrophosphoryl-undecaprenol N-acetylglucosamine transferase
MADCIVFTGGGTAGHVFPALAVLDALSEHHRSRVVWIGSSSGMEREILNRRGIPYYGIPSGKLRRYFSLSNFTDLFLILAGILASLFILLKEKPGLVFSKGGYVTVPPLLAARLLRIPAFTHESDLKPGLATRINSRLCEKVLVSFAETAGYFQPALRGKVLHTGNPVRAALLAGDPRTGRELVGCSQARKMLLVLGGSLGSAFINGAVLDGLERLTRACFVVHQMGGRHFRPSQADGYHPVAFLGDELPHLLAAADLVLCRAGANTLWELAALGKPAVLVPLAEHASRGDQIANARFFAERGAAVVLSQQEAGQGRLVEAVLQLVENEYRLADMGRCARALARPQAAERIVQEVLERLA